MNLFQKIDYVVWGETDDVWNETFAFLIQHVPSANVSEENVMKCISNRHDEFKDKYYKVLWIMDKSDESEGLLKLLFHYQRIMFRYRSAYDCCKTIEYVLV
jgi:hypothetical protein